MGVSKTEGKVFIDFSLCVCRNGEGSILAGTLYMWMSQNWPLDAVANGRIWTPPVLQAKITFGN
jgi:hypothetical protein